MTTSLASQLNALKISQRDALQVPQRVRISFLFDSKQAQNIDDQTLFYICKAGIKQLRDDGHLDLSAFEGDILNEKSLTYYRGTETKETNQTIDDQVEALIKALSPHLLEQSALKVVEYLIRIYEVHVYLKQSMLLAFMPLFETVYFLRISQCLNLKEDQVWGWLHEFAYQGQSIDKQTLVKCISRHNGLVFSLCAKYCLEVKGELHTKWFGSFLSEVLKTNENDGLMFNILPLVTQSLKQWESRDLRISSLFALGQIACRRTLTQEYLSAFVKQILQTLGASDQLEFDEDLKIKGITTLLFFTQYQQVVFDKKQFQALQKIKKVSKLLTEVSKVYDTSSLCKVILDTNDVAVEELRPIITPLLNLKSVFVAVQNLVVKGSSNDTPQVRQQLALIKDLQPDGFKQSAIYILKQIVDPGQRDKIISLLQDDSDSFTQFGSGSTAEYSILSALSSQRKMNRDSALSVLVQKDYVSKLNQKEKSLVHLILLQVLEHSNHDQESLQKLLIVVQHMLDQASDVDYDILHKLLDQIVSGSLTYNEDIATEIVKILCSIKVTRTSNTKSQAWLSIQHTVDLQTDNPYINLSKVKSVSKNNDDAFVRELMKKPQHAINLLTGIFSEYHSAFDYGQIAKLLRRIGQATQRDIIHSTVVDQLFLPILSFMKQRQFAFANELISAIVDTGLITDQFNLKLISKTIGVSLVQKQWNPAQVDLLALHKRLSNDKQRFAELMVRIAVSSRCKVKRIFACQVLQAFHQKGKSQFQLQTQLSCKIMIGVVLMLLNDQDRQIREHGIQLADTVQQMQQRIAKESGIEVIEIFCDTDKPQSAQKKPSKLTPMKSKSVSTLLQDLIDAKSDLILDRSQLKQVLTKHQKPEVFEEILRTLLDYPTFQLKQNLLQVLTLPQKHAMIFCMNLSQVLQKLFIQVDRQSEQCDDYLKSLGQLISHLQEFAVRQAQKEILTSLSLPFLKYIVDKKVLIDQVYIMLDTNILVQEILKEVDQRVLKEIFKIYIKSAVTSPKIKHLFVQRAPAVYKGDDLAVCLSDTPNQELALETIIQIASPNSGKLFDQAIQILEQLISRFTKDEDVAYLIDLSCQVALLSLPSKDKTQKIKVITNIANKVWNKTQEQVQKGLNAESIQVEDPFDQFMKEPDSNSEDDSEVDLLGCLQVTVSIMNLLTTLESSEGQIQETTGILQQFADYLVQVCVTQSSTDQSSIKSQLYYLYQSLILRTTKHQNIQYSQIVVTYVQSCVQLVDNGAMSKLLIEQGLVMNTLKQVQDYSALVLFTLLWDARKQVSINDQNLILTDTAALYLAQELLLWQLDYCQDLQVIQDLMYLVHSIQIEDQSQVVQQQTDILFSEYTSTHLEASKRVVADSDAKQKRKFIFLVAVLFTQFFQKTPKVISKLGEIAGTETPQQSVQDQLLNILLSSYIMKEQVSQLLIHNSNASLVRLQTVLATWQTAINQIMSLQIHIQLVIAILDMQVLSLKINTLCLLIDKLSSFTGGWLSKCSTSIHRVVSKLVQKCVTMLQQQQPESLAQLLLTVLSKTASQSLAKELQTATLEITLQQHKGSLQLQTQAILTEMTLMETYSYQMLDYFHVYLKHTLDGFKTKETAFVDTYKHALLKSLVCITGIFLKFLTADQLEQVITYSITAAAEGVIITKEQDSVEIVLESIASEAVNHKKLVLQATMNSYSLLASNTQSTGFDKMSQRYFTQLLAPVIRRLPQSFISEHHQKFVTFFKQMYGLPVKQPLCTDLLVNCFNAFILKLNEETLRPIIVALSKWSAKESQRKIVFYQIMIGCLNTLREFFVPMVKIYFDNMVATLVDCYTALSVQSLTKRTHSATSDAGLELLVVVCKLVEVNYKFDSNAFLQNDSFEVLCDPIANLFDLYTLPDFDQFVAQNLKPLILEMDERTQDDNMWQKLNYTLLMKTRSENWQTRLAVLQVIDHLFDKMRERYLVILNDTIPFVSELLEDEHEKVELAAKTIVNRIEQLTGESINEYLK